MVVCQGYIKSAAIRPPEPGEPLVIDANDLESLPVALQGLETSGGQASRIDQTECHVDRPSNYSRSLGTSRVTCAPSGPGPKLTSSTVRSIKSTPHPRGRSVPANLASTSGGLGFSFQPVPWSMISISSRDA